ncbi:hypothetical protein QR680_002731 [Steinernema hermaphroditum]|uniref:Uncharacterized protein n=1 Tax=Steinernema hermaphroditum TaxID=289476 RepID=A0AA39H5Y7_9BILA|nr:hypothetical protein QR680_002731 [Steinernema hermaphroditum]
MQTSLSTLNIPSCPVKDLETLIWCFLPKGVKVLQTVSGFCTNVKGIQNQFKSSKNKFHRWFFIAIIVYFCARQFIAYFKRRMERLDERSEEE